MLKQLKETINKRPKANQDKDVSPTENDSIDRNQKSTKINSEAEDYN